jgi:hypothetical protein
MEKEETKMTKISLHSLEEMFQTENFDCFITEEMEESGKKGGKRLSIPIGTDSKERPLFLEIKITQEYPSETLPKDDLLAHEQLHAVKNYYFLHFFVMLPFDVKGDALGDTARLLLLLNKSLDLPGFDMSEVNQVVFYRYTWASPALEVDKLFLLSIVGMIMLIIDSLSYTIEKVASGEASLMQIVEQAQAEVKQQN